MSLRPQVKASQLSLPKGSGAGERLTPAQDMRLTAREIEVMHWVTEGKRDREIAIILGVSPRTVEKHVGHILEKLQVETRTAAVNQCRDLLSRALGDSAAGAEPFSSRQARQDLKAKQ
jgi:DNA-binding CsgD family transcriptional regulator